MKINLNDVQFTLEAITPAMYGEIYTWRSDPFAVEHNPFAPCDFDEFSRIMNDFTTNMDEIYSGKDFKWVISHQGEILSVLSLSQINRMMRTAEVGYQVNPKFRGIGVGTKAVFTLAKYLFENTDLRKLVATIADGNIPSCKIVEKVGFRQEGLLREHFLIGGKEVDERFYGLLRNEFLERQIND